MTYVLYIAPAYNLVLWMYFVFKICIYKRETSKPASFEGVQYNSLFLELFPLPIINLIINVCLYLYFFKTGIPTTKMVADGHDYGTTDRFWILRKLDVYYSPPAEENEM